MVYRNAGVSALLVQLIVGCFAAVVLSLKYKWSSYRQRLGATSLRLESPDSRDALPRRT
jgi:hypothetical protein